MKESKPIEPGLISTPFNYSELVEYQEGSIVSRTIIDKDIGTITVFAFHKGQKLSTHSAPFDALLQVVDGKGLITIEDRDYELTAPQAIIMPADKPHAVNAPENFKMVLTMIRSK